MSTRLRKFRAAIAASAVTAAFAVTAGGVTAHAAAPTCSVAPNRATATCTFTRDFQLQIGEPYVYVRYKCGAGLFKNTAGYAFNTQSPATWKIAVNCGTQLVTAVSGLSKHI